jgi:hypothetical protein
MFCSGGVIVAGKFTPGAMIHPEMNMDAIIGSALAASAITCLMTFLFLKIGLGF